MRKKLYITLAIILAAMILLAGCQRSATNAPFGTATQQGTRTVPQNVGGATQDPMTQLELFASQTAMYATGLPTATATPVGQTGTTPMASATNTSVVPPAGQATNTPVVVATTPVASTVVTRPTTYTLQNGEYPYCIARRFNVNPDDLLALNGLSTTQLYPPGLTLKIPSTGTFPGPRALHTHPGTYTVVADDTIYGIACYYGDVDPLAIATANKLVAPYKLTVGQTLTIP